MNDEELRMEWLKKKMMRNVSWTDDDDITEFLIRGIHYLDDHRLEIVRAWINGELARRKEMREHPIENLFR